MSKVKRVEKQIWDVEGFAVCILYEDGRDVRGDRQDLPMYSFSVAAKNDMTIAEWKEKRFHKCFPGFAVTVLDAGGYQVHGATKLGTVRDTYYDE